MRFLSLTLHNIRSYTQQTINFPEGTILLSGDIGAGKTTLLLAIEFALFGIKRGTLSGDALLRHGEQEGWVEFTFALHEKQITIRRSLQRTKSGVKQEAGSLIVDGIQQDYTAVELKTKVFELLGYPMEFVTKGDEMVYRYTVYTPQEEMKSILFAETQERLDILRRILGVDRYKRIRENASTYAKELRIRIRESTKQLEGKREAEEKKTQAETLLIETEKGQQSEKSSSQRKKRMHHFQHVSERKQRNTVRRETRSSP